ncbi:hypothetical protein L4C34_05975 [Vibrio profundum]|uniref:hypothetical protein n=1 Tax=Vibrio profundum TaxID=2910247 RepID=UPI003D0FA4D5
MKKILEPILLMMTIGGGFAGIDEIHMKFSHMNEPSGGDYFVIGVALLLQVYVVIAGVMFAHNKTKMKHLKRALLLQVPWISSPFLFYRFGAGVDWTVIGYAHGVNGYTNFGNSFGFEINPHYPWAIGVNFVALALYLLILKVFRSNNDNYKRPVAST